MFRAAGAPTTPADLEPAFAAAWEELARELEPGRDRYGIVPGGEREFWRRFVARVIALAGLSPQRLDPFETLFEWYGRRDAWRIFPDALPALQSLRAAGFRLGIISNWDSRLPTLLETLDLARWFEPIVVSAIEGIEKPDPEIFARAARRAGVDAKTVVYIGDSVRFDVNGARGAGMIPLLVRRDGPSGALDVPDAGEPGCRIVRDLVDAAAALAHDAPETPVRHRPHS